MLYIPILYIQSSDNYKAWSLPTHGIQVERPNRKKLACVLAMEEILSSGNYGSAFTVHFLSEEARELHGVVGDRAVAKVIHGEGVADPGSRIALVA